MKTNLLKILMLISTLNLSESMAASYDTLPKGVNTLGFKQVITQNLESKFNESGEKESINLKEEFSSSKLEDLSAVIKTYFNELKAISPEAYSNFSLGEFNANINANLTAQGVGYGYGLTDRLTIYGSLPFYHIMTDVRVAHDKSTISNVQNSIKNAPTNSLLAKLVQDLTLQLPNTNAELLQSIVVNHYGYKPIGKWQKDALGDMEIGAIYRLTDFYDRGVSLTGGLILPTGDADDADSLQDIPTGDGQVDTFVEVNSGISLMENKFDLDLKTRYTYQFSSNKTIRLYDDANLPLSTQKAKVHEKLGNKIETQLSLTHKTTDYLNLSTAVMYNTTGKTQYLDVQNAKIKQALETNTQNEAYWLKLGIAFSTVELYRQKKFAAPMDIALSAQRLLNAKNLSGYDRIDVDFRMYF